MRRWQVIVSVTGFLVGLAMTGNSMMFSRFYFIGIALIILSAGGFVFWVQNANRARQVRRNAHRNNGRRQL
jgi:hypothetical protein